MSKRKPIKYASPKQIALPKRKLGRQINRIRFEAKIIQKAFSPEELERICKNKFGKSHDCLTSLEMRQLLDELRVLIKSKKIARLSEMTKEYKRSRQKIARKNKAWITFSAFESSRRRH